MTEYALFYYNKQISKAHDIKMFAMVEALEMGVVNTNRGQTQEGSR